MKNKYIAPAVLFVCIFLSAGCSRNARPQSRGASPVSDFSYDLSTGGEGVKITGYTGKGGKVIIPSIIEGLPVVEIKGATLSIPYQGAFQGHPTSRNQYFPANRITEITVPSSVTVIGPEAFQMNDNLVKVTLPDGIKVFESALFNDCGKLTSVNLPAGLEIMDMYVFEKCGELNNLAIPAGIASITFIEGNPGYGNNFSFRGCGKLPLRTRQAVQNLGYPNEF